MIVVHGRLPSWVDGKVLVLVDIVYFFFFLFLVFWTREVARLLSVAYPADTASKRAMDFSYVTPRIMVVR